MSVPRFAELLLRPAPEPDISWGLYVYRATYEDQDLWERYIEYIRNAVISRLHPLSDNNSESDHSRFKRLRDSFQLFIKEDNNWDNLTLFQIRNTGCRNCISFTSTKRSLWISKLSMILAMRQRLTISGKRLPL
ncbi:hypothetical protein F4825DRAFT_418404 [Nemania diffusa]|nr:hypothetical protein F4825DRAFT_418404 [Nemania diffusa]